MVTKVFEARLENLFAIVRVETLDVLPCIAFLAKNNVPVVFRKDANALNRVRLLVVVLELRAAEGLGMHKKGCG